MLEAWKKNSGMRELSAFMEDDSGVGVIEVKTTFLFPK